MWILLITYLVFCCFWNSIQRCYNFAFLSKSFNITDDSQLFCQRKAEYQEMLVVASPFHTCTKYLRNINSTFPRPFACISIALRLNKQCIFHTIPRLLLLGLAGINFTGLPQLVIIRKTSYPKDFVNFYKKSKFEQKQENITYLQIYRK